ncbi:hypothetical protein [Streptomyces sp. NPDC005438]|uniref:hypothetical protein n=1 Tax=Streptomyces sp. NPDC005438 TaxID=3156880 RepID=UPI0033A3F6CD
MDHAQPPDVPERPTRHRRGRSGTPAPLRGTPCTVAVALDPASLAALQGTSPSDQPARRYARYLHHLRRQLDHLRRQGLHLHLAPFDLHYHRHHCRGHRLPPHHPDSHLRSTLARATEGATAPYTGTLPTALARLRRGTPDTAKHAATALAGELLATALWAAGPGPHHLVCWVESPEGDRAEALTVEDDAPPPDDDQEVRALCEALAQVLLRRGPGALMLRSGPDGRERVRGWVGERGGLRPLTAAEIFAAYCTDPDTGEPLPPEHGVRYVSAYPLHPSDGFPTPPTDPP